MMTTNVLPQLMALPLPDIGARWSGGGDELRPLGAGKFTRQPGLYIVADQDEGLSVALDQAGVPRYEANHRASGTIDTVHFLGTAFTVYVLIAGVAARRMTGLSPEAKAALAAGGIGNRWKSDQRTGKNTSQVAVMAYLQAAWQNGYGGLIRLQFSGYQSDAALGALVRHCTNVALLGRALGRALSPVEVPLQLVSGEPRVVGSGEKSTEIVPIAALELDLENASTQLADDELREQAASDWPAVQQWAVAYSGAEAVRPAPEEDLPPLPVPDDADPFLLEGLQ